MFVNYHFNVGSDRIYLFFDDPNDDGIELFQTDSRISCVRCDAAYWAVASRSGQPILEERQLFNAALALKWAREEGVDWLFHIDSDELLFAPGDDLRRYLESVGNGFDAVTFPTLEALPKLQHSDHVFRDTQWFKIENSPVPGAYTLARLVGCHRAFRYGYFRGHTIGKSAVRVRSRVVGIGIHLPYGAGDDLHVKRATDAYVLHYDCCMFDDWLLKWKRRHDGEAVFPSMRDDRKRQLSEFSVAYKSGSYNELQSTYKRQCIVPTYEILILLALGLLRRIKLRSAAFLESNPATAPREHDSLVPTLSIVGADP
jgi:hypothetical protein